MTLVLGTATKDIGFLVADTLLSTAFELKGHEGPINGKFHALKIQILNPKTAVAFAGDVASSLNAIGTLHDELSENANLDVGERLFQISQESGCAADCEFLVLLLTPDAPKLAHVTSKGVAARERAHIGDDGQYKEMTKLRKPYHPPQTQHVQQPDGSFVEKPLVVSAGEIEFTEISLALEDLTNRRKGRTGAIAGAVTRVVNARISGNLEYLQSGEAALSPAEGKAGYSFLASNSGVRGVGIFYRVGKLGFVFVVGDSEPCRKEEAGTLDQFVSICAEKYGLHLSGPMWAD